MRANVAMFIEPEYPVRGQWTHTRGQALSLPVELPVKLKKIPD